MRLVQLSRCLALGGRAAGAAVNQGAGRVRQAGMVTRSGCAPLSSLLHGRSAAPLYSAAACATVGGVTVASSQQRWFRATPMRPAGSTHGNGDDDEVLPELEEVARAEEALGEDDVETAIAELEKALPLVAAMGPHQDISKHVLLLLAETLTQVEDFERAAAFYERYLFADGFEEEVKGLPKEWISQLADNPDNTQVLRGLSRCYMVIERYKDAHSILKALRDLYKEQKETLGQAQTELDLAELYMSMGNEEKAKKWIGRVVKTNAKVEQENLDFSAYMDVRIGDMVDEAMPELAVEHLKKAIQKYDELLKSAEDEEDVMSYKMQLYACNLHLSDLIHNNFNDEKHHLEQALKIAREIEGEDKRSTLSAWALNCLGNCYSKNNQNPIHAEGFFRSALSIYEDPATNIRNDEEEVDGYMQLLDNMIAFYVSHRRDADADILKKKLEELKQEFGSNDDEDSDYETDAGKDRRP